MTRTLPVFWLYGPSGVGKTTTAWALYEQLASEGVRTGYVDIDQLGMCYGPPTADNWAPEPGSDPGRHKLKTQALNGVAANYRAAGAQCLIVSGIMDPRAGVDRGLLPDADLTLCRLRAEPEVLRHRMTVRGRPHEPVDEILRDADALDANDLPGVCIDTTGLDAADVLALAAKQFEGRTLPEPGDGPGAFARASATGSILWLCGPRAVGKSAVGWQVYLKLRRAGHVTAFADLDQIGFYRDSPTSDDRGHHELKAANLGSVWETFRARGCERLAVVGPLDRPEAVEAYRAALPNARITMCRLDARPETLAARAERRGQGLSGTFGMPGDDLVGRSREQLRRVIERATAELERLERAGVADFALRTDDSEPAAIADEAIRLSR